MTFKVGLVDFDDYFIKDSELVSRFINNRLYKWTKYPAASGSLGNTSVTGAYSALVDTNVYQKAASNRYQGLTNFGIKKDGTLWAWGVNDAYGLGDGTTTNRSSPVQIGSSTWSKVAPGYQHTLAIKSDGTLWAWGDNFYGQVFNSYDVALSTPNLISGIANKWKDISAGGYHSLALADDGYLYGFGYNVYGQVGNGIAESSTLSPVLIMSDVVSIGTSSFNSYAIKKDGTLWAWGFNAYGNVPDGTTVYRSSPVQIGTDRWRQVEGGHLHAVGVKLDGTLWGWGAGLSYQFGYSSDQSSPAQIGTLNNWQKVSANYYASYALNQSGDLYGVGFSLYGEINETSFGSVTNWSLVHPQLFYSGAPSNTTLTSAELSLLYKKRPVYEIDGPIAIALNV